MAEKIPGVPVDSSGGRAVDPTANVVALSEAATRRQDDLREVNDRRIDAELKCLNAELDCIKVISALRAEHVDQILDQRGQYTNRLAEAEAKRIDAIRAVDVNAVAVANERQAAAAIVLANQVAQSSDALRTLVSTTAAAVAEQQRQSTTQLTDRLTVVERSQYEGRGKQLVADPMIAELVSEMKSLRESRATGAGKSEGVSSSWGLLIGAVSLVGSLIVVGSFAFRSTPVPPQPPAPPQIIYVPAPAGAMVPPSVPIAPANNK